MLKLITAALLAAIALLAGGSPVKADTFDTALSPPWGTFFGTGNPNVHWTVGDVPGVELGLQALIRYTGPITPDAGTATYRAPTGATVVPGKSGSAWGFAFSVGVPGLTLGDITASLCMVDVGLGASGCFDPLAIPDNDLWGPSGKNVAGDAGSQFVAQNSEALSFAGIAAALGDPGYNINADNTYRFALSATCPKCETPDLGSVSMDVIVGRGASVPVPEPGTMAVLGLGLVGLSVARRRRAA